MHKNLLASLIIASVAAFASCSVDPEPLYPVPNQGNRVLVACEGMLGSGNAAITAYLTDSNRTTEDIYQATNKLPLGDILQSITPIGNQYFLCINNSDKIVVVNRTDFRFEGSIAILKPRYVLLVSDTKAYVSTLFSDKIYIINPKTLFVTGTITMPFQNPEGLVMIGKTAYVCAWDTSASAIYPINIANDSVGVGIQVGGRAPQEILQDIEGMLWVLSGNEAKGIESRLTRLDPATGSVLHSYAFGHADPLRPVFNDSHDTLYFIEVSYSGGAANSGIYRMGIHDASLPAQAFIPTEGLQYFWGVGIHPKSGNIYVADPVGFTQRGKVYIYKPDGTLVTTFPTGVGPGHFLFE